MTLETLKGVESLGGFKVIEMGPRIEVLVRTKRIS